MFHCDNSITNRRLLIFQNEGMHQIRATNYVLYLELYLLSLYQKRMIICLKALVKSHEAYWTLQQIHPILSAKLGVYIWQLRVLGQKRALLIAGSLLRTSLVAMSAA